MVRHWHLDLHYTLFPHSSSVVQVKITENNSGTSPEKAELALFPPNFPYFISLVIRRKSPSQCLSFFSLIQTVFTLKPLFGRNLSKTFAGRCFSY